MKPINKKLCKCGCGQHTSGRYDYNKLAYVDYVSGHNNKHSIKIKCEICGKKIMKSPSYFKRCLHHFCGNKCHGVYWHKQTLSGIKFKCVICGKEGYKIKKTLIKKNNVCSRECFGKLQSIQNLGKYMGRNGTTYKHGKYVGIYPYEFNDALKEGIRQRDGYKCRVCGVPQQECEIKLAVHHVDFDKHNSEIINLMSVCKRCHSSIHRNRKTKRAYKCTVL